MQSEDLMPRLIFGLRNKDVKSFEDIFLLTYENTLSDIRQYVSDEKESWDVLADTYIQLWNRSSSVPEKKLLRAWIRILIKESLKRLKDIEANGFTDDVIFDEEDKPEQKALGILIEIEEILEISEDEEPEKKQSKAIKMFIQIAVAVFTLVIAVFIIVNVFDMAGEALKKKQNLTKKKSSTQSEATVQTEKKTVIGWQEVNGEKKYMKSNGKLATDEFLDIDDKVYYFDSHSLLNKSSLEKEIFTYNFDKKGILKDIKSKTEIFSEDGAFQRELRDKGYEERAKNIVAGSVVEDGTWVYFMENLESRQEGINLLRYRREDGYLERVDTDVSGYIVFDARICYCKNEQIKFFKKYEVGTEINKTYSIVETEGAYGLRDTFGDMVDESRGESVSIGDRIYYISGKHIDRVAKKDIKLNDREYSVRYGKIYVNKGKVYVEEGERISAITAIGYNIYYSVVLKQEDGYNISQIKKINVNTGEKKEVTEPFRGSIYNMYYYEEFASIYLEYLPESPKSIQGKIAILDEKNEFLLVNDTSMRAGIYTSGSDILKILMVEKEGIYCYLSDCVVNEEGKIEVVDRKPLLINPSSTSRIK